MRDAPINRPASTLVIVGDTLHHVDSEGRLCTHGALAAQLDLWAAHFDAVQFCGVLGQGPPPPGFAPYRSARISLVPLRQAGGASLRAKVNVVRAAASWLWQLVPALRAADGVHLRTPCNVTLLGIPLARLLVKNRYAIFAGSWDPYAGEPKSYKIQRWMLKHLFGGTVHAYRPAGHRPADTATAGNVRPGFSPVLTAHALACLAASAIEARSVEPPPGEGRPLRVACVGRFSLNKNQTTLASALRDLHASGMQVQCRFIGDGPELARVRASVELPGVTFTEHASRDEVFATMTWADVNVLPSLREGFPKVLLEGMSAGALPIASDTPVNRSMVQDRGWTFDPNSSSDLAHVLETATSLSEAEWTERRARSRTYAEQHTIEVFAAEVDHIVNTIWTRAGAR